MIGETIKLGFDGSAVSKGIKGVLGGFGKLRRGITSATKQVGTGVARQAGYSLFGTVMKGLTAVPNELKNLAMLNKELDVMGKSTGIAEDRYLALRSAISKATGYDPDEATDFVRDVSERLGEAMTDFESTPRKAMIAMGIRVGDLKGKNVDEQMKVIGEKFKSFQGQKGTESAMFQINELLGEIGKKMVPLFLDYDTRMESAAEKTKGLAEQMKTLKGDLEGIGDIERAFSRKLSEASLGVLSGLKAGGLQSNSIASWIESIDIVGKSKGVSQAIASEMNSIKENGLWEWIKEKLAQLGAYLSKTISEAITSGIKNALPSLPSGGFMKLFSSKSSNPTDGVMKVFKHSTMKSNDPTSKMIAENTERTNILLERLTDAGPTPAVYA